MNDVIIYSRIIKICNDNNYKLLKFFILDELKQKFNKKKFMIIIFMSNKIKNKPIQYHFLDNFIKKNYSKIIKFYSDKK